MAEYYVDQVSGLDSNPGAYELPWKTLAKIASSSFNPGDIIYLKRGCTWLERLAPPSSGTSENYITFSAYGAGEMPRISISTNSAGYVGSKSYVAFEYIDFITGQYQTIHNISSTGIKYVRCVIRGNGTYGVYQQTSGDITFNRCTFVFRTPSKNFYITAGQITLRNCLVLGGKGTNFSVSTGAVVDYDYCVFNGCGSSTSTLSFQGSTGTFIDGGHNKINIVDPKLTSYQYIESVASIQYDGDYAGNSGGPSYYNGIASVMESIDSKMSFFWVPSMMYDSERRQDIVDLYNAGHECAVHSFAHMTSTASSVFTVATTNADPYININRATKTITLGTSTPGNTVSLVWSEDWDVSPYTLGDLKLAINPSAVVRLVGSTPVDATGKGWTIHNLTPSQVTTDQLQLKALADTGGDITTFPYTVMVDQTAFLNAEYLDSNDFLYDLVGEYPQTMVYPGYTNDANVRAFVRNFTGYIGSRGSGTAATNTIEIFNTPSWNLAQAFSGTKSQTDLEKGATHAYFQSLIHGDKMSFNIHSDNDVDTTRLGYWVGKFKSLGGNFIRYDELVNSVLDDYTTSDGYTYTRTHTDLLNAQPLAGSGLYHAGENSSDIGAFDVPSPDDTAPHLADATATATSPTTATASVSTDDGNGTLYFLASTNATESAATVKAALSQAVTATGAQSISLSALNPETTYYVHFVQINGAGLESVSVVSTNAITTPAIVYPEISATTSASSTSAVSATVTTDTAGGTIYGVLSESATVMEAADIKSGADDTATVSTAGDYTLNETGLATWTQYYWHIVHEDSAGLTSNVLTIPVKTLDISIPLTFSDTAPATLLTVQVWSKLPKKADVEGLY